VDQKWINLVPLLFEGISISRHVGLNAAFWNLHERTISDGTAFFYQQNHRIGILSLQPVLTPIRTTSLQITTGIVFGKSARHHSTVQALPRALLASRYNYFKAFSCHYVAILQEIKKNRFMEKVDSGIRKCGFRG